MSKQIRKGTKVWISRSCYGVTNVYSAVVKEVRKVELNRTAYLVHIDDGQGVVCLINPSWRYLATCGGKNLFDFMNYNGGKNGAGVYQRLISMMPPHRAYVELFLGSGAVMRRKLPAEKSLGFDLDKAVLIESEYAHIPNLRLYCQNAVEVMKSFAYDSRFWRDFRHSEALFYLDPPYLASTRKSKSKLYKFEMMTEVEHVELLQSVFYLPNQCRVMISGYESELYNQSLKGWRKETFTTSNRAGDKVTETVWLNFPEPVELHDYRFLGKDATDRQRIKRKAERWVNGLNRLDSHERYAIMEEIAKLKASGTV